MTATVDLSLFPFYRIKGQEWAQIPGLLAKTPPRRTSRGREDDRLVLYLTLSGNTPLSSTEYTQTCNQMAERFFNAAGSLTSAIRVTVETLNQSLVDRNLRTTGKGQYTIGRLILGVLRGSQFTFAQCGPTHVFHIQNGEAHQVHDPQISGRGLGIGQTTPLYFSQINLQAGDQMVFCADLPSGWDETLLGERFASPEALREKLLSLSGEDLNAIFVQVQTGTGDLNIFKAPVLHTSPGSPLGPATAPPSTGSGKPSSQDPVTPATTSTRQSSRVSSERPASRFARILSGEEASLAADAPEPAKKSQELIQKTSTVPPAPTPGIKSDPEVVVPPVAASVKNIQNTAVQQARNPATLPPSPNSRGIASSGRFIKAQSSGELPEIKRPSARRQSAFRGLAKMMQGVRTGSQKFSKVVGQFLPNLLPGYRDDGKDRSGSGLAFLAIAIPLVIVTVAALVYTRYGRMTQFQDNFSKAQGQAVLAHGQTNPTDVRHAWDSTIYYLDLAEKYQVTQDSRNLRQEAQTALDNLDSIIRLNFQPAIVGGLNRTVQVTRLAATNTDLYLLDASHGSVIRASLGSQGYEVDTSFSCGPGVYGSTTVGNLIDIEALQMSNDFNARVMGIDAGGNLLYCGFNMDPVAAPLNPPPLGWQKISAFTLDTDGNYLYILDPLANSVWVYQGNYGKFTDLPTMFFGEQVPQNMNASIDLAANNSDLYLLFGDGHVASCPASHYSGVPLRCTDPVTFVDNRPERQPGPNITDAIFNQLAFAAAPDPLLYMLEPLTRAVYYFSPRSSSLELRGQYRAPLDQTFVGSALALTISPNHNIFFSIGSDVYFATNVH